MKSHNSKQLQFLVLKRHPIPEANLGAQTSLTTPSLEFKLDLFPKKRKPTRSLGWREASVKGKEARILVFVFVSFPFKVTAVRSRSV